MTVAGNHDWWKTENTPKTGQEYINFYELPKNGPGIHDETSYYFSYGNVFVMAIGYDHQQSASPKNFDAKVVNWVRGQLLEAKSSGLYDWIFVFHHEPAFSVKITDDEREYGDPKIRYWHPIFMEFGVDFVLNGHNHHYERITVGHTSKDIRSHNITYVVSGGGGGGGGLDDVEKATFNSTLDRAGFLNYYGRSEVALKTHHFTRFSVDGTSLTFTAIDYKGEIIDVVSYSK